MDAEVATEAMLRAQDHDTVILGSGDGDFVPLVNSLRMAGKSVWLMAAGRSVAAEMYRAVGGPSRVIDMMAHATQLNAPPGGVVKTRTHAQLGTPIGREVKAPPSGRSVLLIDMPSLHCACRDGEGWSPDYARMAAAVPKAFGAPVEQVVLFNRDSPEIADRLYRYQRAFGWRVSLKVPKRDECSLAVEMSMAAVEAGMNGHGVVLATSSGHLLHAVRRLQDNRVRVGLMGPEARMSKALRAQFAPEEFYNMSEHREDIAWRSSHGFLSHPALPLRSPTPQPREFGRG